jgi:hypothetical protein
MRQTLSTASVAPGQRLAFWADLVCNTYVQLDCEAAAGASSIDGEIVADTLGSLQLSRVTASPQVVRRTNAQIARASEDFFLVSIQTRGEGVVQQDGRAARLAPGDFALYDSTRPYTLRFAGDFQQIVLRLPGPSLRSSLRNTPQLTASTVSGARGAGHLMIGMIRTLARDIHTLAPESAHAVAESVTQILVAGLSALPAARQAPVSQRTAFHRAQIQDCIRARLREPELTVASVAAQHPTPGLAGRGLFHRRVDLGPAPGRCPARPLRPGPARAQRQRHRVLLGLQRRSAFQPGLPRPLWLHPARAARGRTWRVLSSLAPGVYSICVGVGTSSSSRPVSSKVASPTIMCWVATCTLRSARCSGELANTAPPPARV